MAVRGEETAAMPPEQRPDLFAIGLRQRQAFQSVTGEKREPAFIVRRRQLCQLLGKLEQKHQPMRLAFIAVLADDAGQMQMRRRNP